MLGETTDETQGVLIPTSTNFASQNDKFTEAAVDDLRISSALASLSSDECRPIRGHGGAAYLAPSPKQRK